MSDVRESFAEKIERLAIAVEDGVMTEEAAADELMVDSIIPTYDKALVIVRSWRKITSHSCREKYPTVDFAETFEQALNAIHAHFEAKRRGVDPVTPAMKVGKKDNILLRIYRRWMWGE